MKIRQKSTNKNIIVKHYNLVICEKETNEGAQAGYRNVNTPI